MRKLASWWRWPWLCLLAAHGVTAWACEPAANPGLEMPAVAYQRGLDCALGAKSQDDVEAAVAWYQSAAERGHARAMYNLGLVMHNRDQPELANAWFKKSAELGHPGAQYKYGHWLLSTEPAQAIPLLIRSAESGHQRAQILLGDIHMLKQDYVEAYKWYQSAWMSGNLPAYEKQQLAYQRIDPARRAATMDLAVEWMEAFSDRSASVVAMTCSESCLAGGVDRQTTDQPAENASRDDRMWKAARLYCAGARLGSTEPLYRLGMLYLAGAGVPSSRETAVALFRRAHELGHQESGVMLDSLGAQSSAALPGCIASNVDPERKPPLLAASGSLAADPAFKGREWIVGIVESVARGKGVDPRLVLAVIRVESGFNHKAVSNRNAKGLMQLIPDTAARFNVKNVFDVAQNVTGGVAYLRWLLDRYQGDLHKVLAAYNAGEGQVDRYRGVPPFRETREYVRRVMAHLTPATSHGTGRTNP